MITSGRMCWKMGLSIYIWKKEFMWRKWMKWKRNVNNKAEEKIDRAEKERISEK